MSSSSVGGDGGATAGGGIPEGLHVPFPFAFSVPVEGGGGGVHDGSGGLKASPLARGDGDDVGLTLKGEKDMVTGPALSQWLCNNRTCRESNGGDHVGSRCRAKMEGIYTIWDGRMVLACRLNFLLYASWCCTTASAATLDPWTDQGAGIVLSVRCRSYR